MTGAANDSVLNGRRWTLYRFEDGKPYDKGLVSVVSVAPPGIPRVIGTAFLVSSPDENNRTYAITAAHLLSEIRRLQEKPRRSAFSALSEFLPPPEKVNFDHHGVVVTGFEDGKSIVARVSRAVFNEDLDIAVISLEPNPEPQGGAPFFSSTMPLTKRVPMVGDLVMIYGLHNQSIKLEQDAAALENGRSRLVQNRNPVLVAGRVLEYFENGRGLCRGPCIETSIPVTPGMSGSPAILYRESGGMMECFGLVSASSESADPAAEGSDPPGNSIVTLLAPHMKSASRFGGELDLFIPQHNWSDSLFAPG